MRILNRSLYICLAASVALLSGCGKDNKTSSKEDEKNSSSIVQSSNDSSSKAEESHIGKYLNALADKMKQGSYTMKCTVKSENNDEVMKLVRVVSNKNVYQLQEEKVGSYGIISVDGKSYNFDNAAGMYQKTDAELPLSIVEEVVNRNLPQSEDIEIELSEGTTAERYIFTGESYITYITFVFDENNGELMECILTYSIEGEEEVNEIRTVDYFEYEADESYFDTSFLEKMTDFGKMTKDEKLTFCKNVCSERGITSDDLDEYDLSEDDFTSIEFSAFLNLIYSVAEN